MSGRARPVGRRRAALYWRRRLVLAAAVITVAVALSVPVRIASAAITDAIGDALDGGGAAAGAGGAGGEQGAADQGATDQDATEPAPPTTPAAVPRDGDPCTAASVLVTVAPDAQSYAAGSVASVTLTITNTAAVSCTLQVGSEALEVLVTSGSDRIWSSDDCQTESVSDVQELPAGGAVATQVTWDLTRSVPGCATGLTEPRPGTYRVQGRVGDLTSETAPFTLG